MNLEPTPLTPENERIRLPKWFRISLIIQEAEPRTMDEFRALERVLMQEILTAEIRLCARSIKPEDPQEDALMLDNKGYLETNKATKLRMPFQPPSEEFRAIYNEGYRLAKMSFDSGVNIHYWIHPTTRKVATAKIKRQ